MLHNTDLRFADCN